MVINGKSSVLNLKELKNSITEEKKKVIDKKQESLVLPKGVFLFFSFDLVNSTIFKTEHPSLWSSVFTCFYSEVLKNLGVEEYKTPEDDSDCIRRLWKLIGDEVLIYVNVTQAKQLYNQINSVGKVLDGLMEIIAEKVEEQSHSALDKEACKHCQDIQKVILSTLGIKITAWLAECGEEKNPQATNIVYYPKTTTARKDRVDFLGREIDEGFRIAKFAVKNKIILSPMLAWLIWREAEEDPDSRKIVEANFKITAFASMKGVWRGRKVPIVMFHQKFEEFDQVLEYDELDCDTYSNIKEVGIANFRKESRFSIEKIDSILRNVHKKDEAESLYEQLKQSVDIEQFSPKIETTQEFHIACMIFMEDGRMLIHRDVERGLEFGCIKKIFGIGIRDWKKICEEGYREKYNLFIKVADSPVPVATYYYEKKNALGLIIMGDYAGDVEGNREDWQCMTLEEIQNSNEMTVDGFKENVKKAYELKRLEGENGSNE